MQSLRELNEQISEAQKALEHYAGRRFTAPSTCQVWGIGVDPMGQRNLVVSLSVCF